MTSAQKSIQAFRTISEAANELEVPQHVLRFWETKFSHIKPMKRGGGRRYYRPEDINLLKGIRRLLYDDGFTIKGVQKVLRDRGVRFVMETGLEGPEHQPPIASNDDAPNISAANDEASIEQEPAAEQVTAQPQPHEPPLDAAAADTQEIAVEPTKDDDDYAAIPAAEGALTDAAAPRRRPYSSAPQYAQSPYEEGGEAGPTAEAEAAEPAARRQSSIFPTPLASPVTPEQKERLEEVLTALVALRQEIRSTCEELSLPVPNTSAQKLVQRRQ